MVVESAPVGSTQLVAGRAFRTKVFVSWLTVWKRGRGGIGCFCPPSTRQAIRLTATDLGRRFGLLRATAWLSVETQG